MKKDSLNKIFAIMLVFALIIGLSSSYVPAFADKVISTAENEMLSSSTDAREDSINADINNDNVVEKGSEISEDNHTRTIDEIPAVGSDSDEIPMTEESTEDVSEEETVEYPAFSASQNLGGGVQVSVSAPAGVFPEGSTLNVSKVSKAEQNKVDNAVNALRDDDAIVAMSYTYDVKILDMDKNELQPSDDQSVSISFYVDKVSNPNLSTTIYHIPEENGNLVADSLSITEKGNVVTAKTDGFSYYTVEFTYEEKQYVMQGDSKVALTDILSFVGISARSGNAATDSSITSVSVSNESLFSASNEGGKWIVTAHQAFTSTEWMKVTVDGVEYEIVVTDAIYTTNQTGLSWQSGNTYVKGATYAFNSSGSNYVNWTGDKEGSASTGVSATIDANGKITFSNGETQILTGGNNAWELKSGSSGYGAEGGVFVYYFTETYYNPKHTVIYNANGGSVSPGSASGNSSDPVTLPTPTRSGYTFDGWYTAASGGTKVGDGGSSYKPSEDITIYAHWTVISATAPTVTSSGATLTYGYSSGNVNVTATAASGHTITGYQWYDRGTTNSNTGGTAINGATNASYSIPTGKNAGTYYYYCVVTTKRTDNSETTTKNSGVATVKINPKSLTLSWGTTAFTYDGTSHAPTASITGVINNDDCTVSVNGAQTNYSATAYTATAILGGAKKGNYTLPAQNTKAFTIVKRDATITAKDKNVTYGTTITSDVTNVTVSGLANGDTLTAIKLTPSTKNVTSSGTITPGTATIKKGNSDVTANYNITYVSGSLTINKKTITINGITAENKAYDGTIAASLNYNGINWAACGRVEGDDLSVTGRGTFSDEIAGVGKTVTITDLALEGAAAGNYELASTGNQTSTTADIGKKAITITADSDTKVYDGTALTNSSYTHSELAAGDRIDTVTVTGSQTASGSSSNVPSGAVITNSLGDNVTVNYEITYANGTLEVTKKPLTITADSAEKVYDSRPLTKDSYTYTDLVDGETIDSVTVTGSQTNVGSSSNVPSTAVIKNGAGVEVTSNYEITYKNGTLKVTGKAVRITADSDEKVYDGTALSNDGYTVTGLLEGDYIDAVTIIGSRIVYGESGNVPSRAVIKNARGDDVTANYEIEYINGKLKVTKKSLTIEADSAEKVYDGTALTKDSYTNSDLASGDRIVRVTVTGARTDAGVSDNVPSRAVIRNQSDEDMTDSYDIEYVNGTLEVTKKEATITVEEKTKVYGDDDPEFTTIYQGFVGAETPDYTLSREEGNDVGSYEISVNLGENDNYDIEVINASLIITKRAVTLVAADNEKIYGDDDPVFEYTLEDGEKLAYEDSISSEGVFTGQLGREEGENVGEYTINQGELDSRNYDINLVTATFSITKRPIKVKAEDIEKDYGREDPELTYINDDETPLYNDDELIDAIRIKLVREEGEVAGEYTITADSIESDNYEVSFTDGTFTIKRAENSVLFGFDVIGETYDTVTFKSDIGKFLVENLTDEDKKVMEEGGGIRLYFEVTKLDKIDALEEEKIKTAAGEGFVAGMYQDISLFRKYSFNDEPEQLFITKSPVGFDIKVTDKVPEVPEGGTREYAVVRVHDGVAEVIPSAYNEELGVIHIDSDKFSTYAVLYKDTVTKKDGDGSKTDKKTGDSVAVFLILCLISLAGTVLVYEIRRRKNYINR